MTHQQKKLAQICQLLALAKSTTFQEERESAKQMAKKLMNRHGISLVEVEKKLGINKPRPVPQPRPTVVVDLGFNPFVTATDSDNFADYSIHVQF